VKTTLGFPDPVFRKAKAKAAEEGVSLRQFVTDRHYAELRQELKRAGTPVPSNGLWIAAQSREFGLPVLSRDAHFDHVNGMRRMSW
jgi:predicted nucleic acid-binding protein